MLASLAGTDVRVNNGTLSGNGSITTGTAGLVLNAGASLAPGAAGSGTLQVNVAGGTLTLSTLAANLTSILEGLKANLAKSPHNNSLVLTLAGNLAIPGWRQTHFGSPANSGEGANTRIPDKDSLPNLVKYLFDTLPRDSTSSLPVLTGQEGNNLILQYSRSKAAANDVTAVVEAPAPRAPGAPRE